MNRILLIIVLLSTGLTFSQQTSVVDFKRAQAEISFGDLLAKEVKGVVAYEFDVLKDVDSVFLDAQNFENITAILDENLEVGDYNGKQLIIKNAFKANTSHKLEITWETSPKKALYFIDWEYLGGNRQIWTQGQGKYTSNWLPSFDDMTEKVEFDLSITFDKAYEVIANGKLINKIISGEKATWEFDMRKPMSSYLVAFAIGKYVKKTTLSRNGVPLDMYYYPNEDGKFEPTYRHTQRIFDFLQKEIGVPYPWQNYKQVPVKDFLYAGMENTSATIFSDAFLIDETAFIDKNYVNVNAHELAHQWFGDLVTETSGTHHWLQEGFATYYALLAEREVFGEDYYQYKLYEYAQELLDQDKAGRSTALLDPKSSSTTFYKKGAWVLTLLYDKVGEKDFKKGVKNYLDKYQFKNVETNDFISEIEASSGKNLSDFVDVWLKSEKFHYEIIETYLRKNFKGYKAFLKLDCQASKVNCQEFLESSENPYINTEVIRQLEGNVPKSVFNLKSIKERQAIAQSVSTIPSGMRIDYESLLQDKSYATIEAALYNLWSNFPNDNKLYLKQTKGVEGFNDKNVRILWLTLALITEDFEPENNTRYFEELTEYTSPKYGFEIRQNAFAYLNQIRACKAACQKNLKQAETHHNWQFSKFAKQLLQAE
ncbi:M1 family metallopeptidase [Tamlana sp. 2_MG-2023]|uniref:M1 family metallopeptidase n=1 Tax=unclassified Tamlana TaxID=2614803 RepID=UPI0026E2B429|nr:MULTISPECIES: M1 family metallopeptidase [unclassified Tamlana]MDO6759331.1 M1 family metallopeptidase [Tamlana sp. 2_MG-2023]MDO6790530.1 M1 family metallopeptidase [Tamlana sp. 1_MG-2023]